MIKNKAKRMKKLLLFVLKFLGTSEFHGRAHAALLLQLHTSKKKT